MTGLTGNNESDSWPGVCFGVGFRACSAPDQGALRVTLQRNVAAWRGTLQL